MSWGKEMERDGELGQRYGEGDEENCGEQYHGKDAHRGTWRWEDGADTKGARPLAEITPSR